MNTRYFLISCEHGGNRIPSAYRRFFVGFGGLLRSHRGYDMGALRMAKDFAAMLRAPLFASTTSRLLVDLNRSVGNPHLYSEATRDAPRAIREEILECCYFPYREGAEADIAEAIRQGRRVVHISSHSFTPELNGEIRNADIGLLYDPGRWLEQDFCNRWRASIRARQPTVKVRRNYPYRGTSDGFVAYLRQRFSPDVYTGIELEVNQKHVFEGHRPWAAFRELLLETLQEVISASKYVPRNNSRYASKGAAARP